MLSSFQTEVDYTSPDDGPEEKFGPSYVHISLEKNAAYPLADKV